MNCIKCKAELPDGAKFCHICGKKQAAEPKKYKKRANGSGTVYKMSGKRSKPWAAKRNGIYIGAFKTYAEAQKALERTTDTDISDKYNMTFREVYEAWLPEHERTLTSAGVEGYKNAYRHCEALREQKFRALRTSDFQTVIIKMEQENLSKSSCEKVVQLFGQLSKWAMRENIATTNYASFVTITAEQKKTRQPFTAEQIIAIQNSTAPAAQIAMILIATGCRPNELFSVPLCDCYDTYFIGGSKTEAGKNRVIAVSPIGLASYQELLAKAKQDGREKLIDAYEGNTIASNYSKRDFANLMKSLGISGMSPYNCRHTFSTLAVKSGVKPELLQKMLGHASYSTTVDVYTHIGKNDIIEEVKKIATEKKKQPRKEKIKTAV